MKKIFFVLFLCLSTSVIFSQLKVTSDGKVGIGITTTPISNLAVGEAGNTQYSTFFYSNNNTMQILSTGASSNLGNVRNSLYINMDTPSSGIYYGLRSFAIKASPTGSGRTVGLLGMGGNATSGYNIGVVGSLYGSNNGAGIYGSASGEESPSVDGIYAGYFKGNVKVTGTVNGTVISSSDVRFKQNIVELGSAKNGAGELKRITNLIPVAYNYKQVYNDLKSDTLQTLSGQFDENSLAFKKRHFGLIAQDLQKIYPDLVYENDNGYLSVNYIEIIPLLIQSIKELKEEVDNLSSSMVKPRSSTANDLPAEMYRAVLYQNAPNPFTDKTEIKFALPDNIKTASIMVFNMQGALVKQIPIYRQQQSITINGSELVAGMYLYSLIVDGSEVDTKRMILTK